MPRQRDKFQVAAFQAFFHGAIVDGKTLEQAFATAIFESRDDKVEQLLDNNPGLVEYWEKQRKGIKANTEKLKGVNDNGGEGEKSNG